MTNGSNPGYAYALGEANIAIFDQSFTVVSGSSGDSLSRSNQNPGTSENMFSYQVDDLRPIEYDIQANGDEFFGYGIKYAIYAKGSGNRMYPYSKTNTYGGHGVASFSPD